MPQASATWAWVSLRARRNSRILAPVTDEEYAGGSVEEEAEVDLSGISFE